MKALLKLCYVIYFMVLISLVTCKIVIICSDGINGIDYVINDLRWVIEDIKQNREYGDWNYNLIPFEAYYSWFTHGVYGALIENLLGNIVAFMPMGFFEMALSKHKKLWKVVLKCFIIVTCLELFQFLSCLGYLDIDDITMNTFGCLLGCLSYYLLVSIRRKAKNFFTKI